MNYSPFRFLSATRSQAYSVANSNFMRVSVNKRQKSLNWVLGLVCVGWMGLLAGCNQSASGVSTLGDWTVKSELEGVARSGAASFVVNNIAYIGTGLNSSSERLNDLWAYDPAKNAWTQKASLPGAPRNWGVGFAVGNQGFMGTGTNNEGTYLKDFWAYDVNANTWKQVADFGGTARYGATAFGIGNKGYVATGFDGNYLKDMWSFDPAANTWTKVASYGGGKRMGAVSFVIADKAYLGTGNNNNTLQKDWYVYDPAQDVWTQKLDFITDQANIARSYGVGFAIDGKGYVTLGEGTNSTVVWQYLPETDTWASLATFEGTGRQYAVGFAINNKGYVTTGQSGSARFDDLWEFDPTVAQ